MANIVGSPYGQQDVQNSVVADYFLSTFEAAYYVNLKDNSWNILRQKNYLNENYHQGCTFTEVVIRYLNDGVLPSERRKIDWICSPALIRRKMADTAEVKVTFVDTSKGYQRYCRMYVIRGNDADHVAIGFQDVDADVRQTEVNETVLKRNLEIIEILASEYSSVYYIDLTTDELNPYTMNAETESEFGQIFNSGISYSEAFKLYVDKLIFHEDKEMMLKAGSIDNIKKELIGKKTFITQYRSSDGKYSEMKFVKVGGDNDLPLAVALGFAERDDEVREEKQRELEQTRYYAVVKALSSEYSSIYYADIDNDILMPYSNSERIVGRFGPNAFAGMTFTQAAAAYVTRACCEKDKTLLGNALSADYIREQLAEKTYFTLTYQNEKGLYCEMKCVRVNETGPVVNIVVGFAVKDDIVREQIRTEEERQRNFDIIEILASEYTSVYYIDLTTDGLNPYTMNEETKTSFGSVFRSGISYSEAFRLYVDRLVLAEDKPMMLRAGSIGNIMKELRTKKTFLTTYRNSEGHYSEMKFVKVGGELGVPTAVALGFADKDKELRARREEETKLKRNIEIIEILASEYSSVYYIDLTTDGLDPYTMNEQTENEFGKIFRSGIHYSDAFKLYVDTLVYPDDKEMMLKAGSIYNILLELGTKKSFITTYRNSEGHYSEMKFVKVGNDENPQSVALGFADKDDVIRAEKERQAAAERDMAVISGLSDDYGCVVHVTYEDASEHHYRFDPMFEKNIPGWSKINDFEKRLDVLTDTIMHPEDRKAFRAATRRVTIQENLARNNTYYVNFRTLVGDEVTYYQAKFARDESSADHVIAGFHNVDAETKREMEALDKAEKASQAKTDFLFNMSHDIRTPMNAIIGFTDMAVNNIDDKEKVLDCLGKVKVSGKMLLSLINDILDMSRIESGKVQLHEEKANLETFFDSLESVMSGTRYQKDIDLSFSISGVRDKYVYMDQPRLERVLVNLLSNAIKYTPEGGSVKARLSQTGGSDGKGVYRFEVEDNGIGMSEEFQKHMWEEFAREETSTISGIQGTGLGLSLALKLTVLMGGRISCTSKQGEGSTFIVTIPLKLWDHEDNGEGDGLQENGPESTLTGKKALLVEDNELNREIAVAILETYGLTMEVATDGTKAVETVVNRGPEYYDFILMDIQMPVMNGYDATREIRRQVPGLKAPIIALSANAFEEDKKKSVEAGMNDHIAKPIDVQELMTTLAKFITT